MDKKSVVITGASKGIGRAAANRLAEKGYRVIGIARTKPLGDFPGDFFVCDMSSESETASMISKLLDLCPIDALVNNLGVGGPQFLGSIDFKTLHHLYDLNVRTAVQMTQGLMEPMKQRRWGRVINLSSRVILGVPGRTSYAAAKSALIGCTRVWALELAPFNITVNAVAPGPIETEMFRKVYPANSEAEKELISHIPLGRVGKTDEVAALIEFIVSEAAGFITGQTLCVDGGGSL